MQTELGEYGASINGQWLKTGDAIEMRSPYNDALVAIVHRAPGRRRLRRPLGWHPQPLRRRVACLRGNAPKFWKKSAPESPPGGRNLLAPLPWRRASRSAPPALKLIWLKEAVAKGAQVLSGGERDGNVWQPTILVSI
jgi:hypothetical protein